MEYTAKKIQELRLKRNLSQSDLADKLGVSRQAVSKWERDEGLPDLYNIKRLAEIFKVSVDELVMDGGNVVIDYRNKTSVILMSIPMAFFTIGILVMLFFTSAYGIDLIGNIFNLGRMVLYNNLYWVFVPAGLMISIVLVEIYLNLLSNHKVNMSRLLGMILYSLILVTSLATLLAFELTGFSTIFIYIFGFIIITIGLIGLILFQKDIRINTGIKDKKFIIITLKALKIIMLSYVLIFALSATQTYILTKPLSYLYIYEANSLDNSFILSVTQDEPYSNIRQFSVGIDYLLELDPSVQNPYLKIYMGEIIIAEGNLIATDNGNNNFKFELEQDDYELPLILVDYSSQVEISCIVTYVLNDIPYSETILPIFRENITLRGSAKTQNLWIWDYKDYIPE
jgi:transcriptional regulator with XRE-family HTH domain